MLVFIHANFKLDLTYLNVTFTELNQWFKDDFSTENSIPFDLYLDSELSKKSGFQAHFNANNKQTIFDGYLDNDGEIKAAVLKFLSIKGNFISAIINAGTDNFPSFDKKLSELLLERKPVSNIIDEAVSVLSKSYPETNYNFPMVHTDKYDPSSADFNGFLKTINNYSAGLFLTNSLEPVANLDLIKNIMQPLPYLMHVVNAGIIDAGFTLAGDILNDADFNQALLFRDGEYYQQTTKEEIPAVYKNNEFDGLAFQNNGFQYVFFQKEITITKKGDYLLFGSIHSIVYSARKNPASTHNRYRCSSLQIVIEKISGGVTTTLDSFTQWRQDSGQTNLNIEIKENSFDIPVSFEVGDIIRITKIEPKRDYLPSKTPDYPEAISLKLIPVRYRNSDGSPIISILNLNEIDLTRVVPDMTFRDLIMIIKNWKNYELIPSGNIIYMNRIASRLNRDSAIKISDFEIEEPEIEFHDDRQFELAFTDGKTHEIYKYDSVLVSSDSVVVNNYVLKDTVSPIKIDALPLPVISRNGITTALSFQDEPSKLRLVFMKPMPQGGAPVAYYNERVLIPAIHENDFKEWLKFRISSLAWNWDFIMSVEKFKAITIQTLVYAYGNYHIFSEIEKERLNSMFWRITAKTESLL
jgi:hypothetical protein